MKAVKILAISMLLAACSSANPGDWRKREQGAAIGGLGGATLGGLVGSQSGNTAEGAVIGGAAGAGAGYLLGREADKSRGRDRQVARRDDYDDNYDRRRRQSHRY